MTELAAYAVFDAIFDVLPVMVNTMIKSKKVTNDAHKEQRAELNKSTRECGKNISNELISQADRMSNGNSLIRIDFIKKATITEKWISYALYYMTNDNPVKIIAEESDKELVNAISNMAGFGKIYEKSGILDINKCDAKSLDVKYYGKYILLIDEIWDRIANPNFQEKMKARMSRTNINIELPKLETNIIETNNTTNDLGFNSRIDSEGYIHPIFFSEDAYEYTPKPIKGEGISDSLFYRLEYAFSGLLNNYKYHYEYIDGNCCLYITRSNAFNAEDCYIIDDGKILGGTRISILARYIKPNGELDTVFVDVANHKDIVAKIINSAFIPISNSDVMETVTDYFNNTKIYHTVDFSNTGFMDNYSAQDMYDLEVSLLGVLQVLDSDVRLRFCEYLNPNNFTLISDNNVNSTLNETCHNIADGLIIKVTDNSITKIYGGNTKLYSMRK